MTNHESPAGPTVVSADEQRRLAYADDFAIFWTSLYGSMMDGRILGYLMITKEPYLSLAQLSSALGASAGSVSMSTRRLVQGDFVKRHFVPGDRSHYFRAERDIWGSWLASERRYLGRGSELMQSGLSLLDSASVEDDAARERLTNGRDYFAWLDRHHNILLAEWVAFKAARDAGEPTKD